MAESWEYLYSCTRYFRNSCEILLLFFKHMYILYVLKEAGEEMVKVKNMQFFLCCRNGLKYIKRTWKYLVEIMIIHKYINFTIITSNFPLSPFFAISWAAQNSPKTKKFLGWALVKTELWVKTIAVFLS